jgi:hypothetical protein
VSNLHPSPLTTTHCRAEEDAAAGREDIDDRSSESMLCLGGEEDGAEAEEGEREGEDLEVEAIEGVAAGTVTDGVVK